MHRHGSVTGTRVPVYVQLVGRFFLSLFLSRRLYLWSRSVFLDRFTRASQRRPAWISRSVDIDRPPPPLPPLPPPSFDSKRAGNVIYNVYLFVTNSMEARFQNSYHHWCVISLHLCSFSLTSTLSSFCFSFSLILIYIHFFFASLYIFDFLCWKNYILQSKYSLFMFFSRYFLYIRFQADWCTLDCGESRLILLKTILSSPSAFKEISTYKPKE